MSVKLTQEELRSGTFIGEAVVVQWREWRLAIHPLPNAPRDVNGTVEIPPADVEKLAELLNTWVLIETDNS